MGLYIDLYDLYENDPTNHEGDRVWIQNGSYIEDAGTMVPAGFGGIADRVSALHYHITGTAYKYTSSGYAKLASVLIRYKDSTLAHISYPDAGALIDIVRTWKFNSNNSNYDTNTTTGYVSFTGSGNLETKYVLDFTVPATQWFSNRYEDVEATQTYYDTGNNTSQGQRRSFFRQCVKNTTTPDDSPTLDQIEIELEFAYKTSKVYTRTFATLSAQTIDVQMYPYSTPPTISSFTMSRALQGGTISQQGQYGRYDITSNLAAILASDEPSFIKSAAELTVSFTRNSTDYKHRVQNDLLLHNVTEADYEQDPTTSGSALQLGNEETFTVTATLTDGINTVSMSALLSANFAIFNANAAKTGIAFGKYATRSGFDCNMDAIFRKSVTFEVSPFEILWVNPNPTSSMAAVNVTMSRAVQEGEFIFSAYRYSNSDDYPRLLAFAFVGVMQMRMIITNSTNNRNGNREVEFTANSATAQIGAGFANNAPSNSTMIPLFFATLRDFKITSAMLSAWVAPT